MRKLQVKDVLTRIKEPIELEDDVEYAQVTVRLKHQGVCLRGHKFGKEIGTKKQSLVRSGQFILSKIDARNGAFGIIPDELDGAIITNDFLNYEVNEKELNIELFRLLTSQSSFDELCNASSTGTTNRKRLNEKVFLEQEITLPPIEEQNSFIEHFKKLQEKHFQTLEELQTQSELINKLRSSILSDAVSGKLVPQDPNDESAEVLLEKIKAEKEKLIKEGKIKKQKLLPPISENEIPYQLPDGWVWCRLGNVILNMDSGWSPKCLEEPSDNQTWGVLKTTAVQSLRYLEDENKTLPKTLQPRLEYEVQSGDILITRAGPKNRVGICCLVKMTSSKLMISDKIIRFHPFSQVFPAFLELSLNSGASNEFIESKKSGMAESQVNISQNNLKLTPIPLPSLKEQKRIVEKVEKLMATCDALELEVQNSKTETEKLMQSVLKEAFSDSDTSKSETKTPKASKAFQRSVLAAYIVDNSLEDRYFGHVKLQKMLFMCEAVNNLDFDSNYKRHAMGPYDPKLIRSVDAQLKRNKWFECKKMDGDKGRYVYSPLEKQDEYKKYLDRYFKLENIEKMFALMKPMTTLQAEIIATLYSVYKDLNSTQQKISNDMLINEARNNWHDRKKTIDVAKWERAIEWMREKQLIF